MTLSLKTEILERLLPKKSAKNAPPKNRKAHTFGKSDAPPVRRKSQTESALPKAGDKVLYEGKQALVKSINPRTGMALVKLPRFRDPKIVRVCDLGQKQALTEGVLGMSAILPTWKDTTASQFIRTDLTAEDIGFDFVRLREDEDTGKEDEQEEPTDNGSNIRHDGHTGKKEIDELPTPSDTIATAYSDDKPPKEISKPLSTEPGYTVAKDPDFDGYDYPADAPEIPKADYEGQDAGNSRRPRWDGHFQKSHIEHIDGDGEARTDESFQFMTEMGDMLGDDDREPQSGETITVTLPAMASIVCTVANKLGHNPEMMKSMIEALAEIGHGSDSGCIDLPDLDAVARHMNGEETQEVENRDSGHSDHEGMAMGDHGDPEPKEDPADGWPGDGEKTGHGKTKLMGAVGESNYFGAEDIMAGTELSEEDELRMVKRRAGLKFW